MQGYRLSDQRDKSMFDHTPEDALLKQSEIHVLLDMISRSIVVPSKEHRLRPLRTRCILQSSTNNNDDQITDILISHN